VTSPAPTVPLPSRMPKRVCSSSAMACCSSTVSTALSPGITISAPPCGIAREDHEVRVAFEQLRSRFMRRRAHDDENRQLIHNVRHAIPRRALGFAKWPAHVNDRVLMLLIPSFQGREAFLVLRAPFVLRHRIPGPPARAYLVAEKDREVGIFCAHVRSPRISRQRFRPITA
jgi:hypothetical protein